MSQSEICECGTSGRFHNPVCALSLLFMPFTKIFLLHKKVLKSWVQGTYGQAQHANQILKSSPGHITEDSALMHLIIPRSWYLANKKTALFLDPKKRIKTFLAQLPTAFITYAHTIDISPFGQIGSYKLAPLHCKKLSNIF